MMMPSRRVIAAALFLLAAPATAADWQFVSDKSPVDGKQTYAVFSPPAKSERYSRDDHFIQTKAFIWVGCWKPGGAFVQVQSGHLIGSSQTPVVYRIDDAKPVNGRWFGSSESGKSLGIFDAPAVALAKQLAKAREFAIRSEQRVFGTMEAVFELDGLATALEPVAKECGWKL